MTIPDLFRQPTPQEAARSQYERAAYFHFVLEDTYRHGNDRQRMQKHHDAGRIAGRAAYLEAKPEPVR